MILLYVQLLQCTCEFDSIQRWNLHNIQASVEEIAHDQKIIQKQNAGKKTNKKSSVQLRMPFL